MLPGGLASINTSDSMAPTNILIHDPIKIDLLTRWLPVHSSAFLGFISWLLLKLTTIIDCIMTGKYCNNNTIATHIFLWLLIVWHAFSGKKA